MASYSRITLVGDHRRVDAVLPSEEPVGGLLPDMLELVGDTMESPPRQRLLVNGNGAALALEHSLAQAEVGDGAVLRLVAADEAPPAPTVHDVTEETARDVDERPWRWGPVARRWTATAATVGLALNAGLLGRVVVPPNSAIILLVVAAVALLVSGALAVQNGPEAVATAVMLSGAALGVLAVWTAADVFEWTLAVRAGGVVTVVAILLANLGFASPLGKGGVTGAGFVALLGVVWVIGGALGLSWAEVAAAVAVASVLLLGLLPRLALSASGLASLDDRRAAGTAVSRRDVDVALAATHRSLVIATAAVAVSAAIAGAVLAQQFDAFAAPMALLTALVLASRSRLFPLVWQVIALQGAAIAIVLVLFGGWVLNTSGTPYLPLLAAVAIVAVPLTVLAVDLPEHNRARLRQIADRLEACAVIAMIPVAIGVFGTYGRLFSVYS